MNAVLNLGKYLFALPFLVFGVLHFMNAEGMAAIAPGGEPTVYITGVALILATVSFLIGKYDKLAAVLLALFLLLTAVVVHLQGFLAGNENALGQVLKDLALAGAALLYAQSHAKDNSVIG